MKIFFWGNSTIGYRQEGFQSYVKRKKHTLFYSKKYLKTKNKYIMFLFDIINDLLNSIFLFKISVVYIPPMEHTILKVMLSRLFSKKIICDIYAPLFDMTVNDEKIYKANSIMGRLYYYRDKFAIAKSTSVLFLNEAEKNHFCQTVNLSACDINAKIVPLVIDRKKFSKKSFFTGNRKKLNICWTGSFIALQGLDTILEAVKILSLKNFDFIFNIIGPNSEKCRIYENLIKDMGICNHVKFIHLWGDMNKWEQYICNECDISLGIFGDSEKAKCVVANKVIDGIAFKTPVITGLSKGLDYYFDQKNDIFTVENNPEDIANKISEVSSMNNEEINKIVNNAYDVYTNVFSEEAYMNNMNRIFKELNKS